MGKLRKLLQPEWIVAIVIAAAFAYLCFSILAPWQLGKNTKTQQQNELLEKSTSAQRVPVDSLVSHDTVSPDDEWRPVTASGSFVSAPTVILINRSVTNRPVYQYFAPFKLDSGQVVLVNRGFMPADKDIKQIEVPLVTAERVTLKALLRMPENRPDNKVPVQSGSYWRLTYIVPHDLQNALNTPLADYYLQLQADSPGVLNEMPLPSIDPGPYLSYGIQWILFGILAPIGVFYFIWARVKERRREEQELQLLTAETSSHAPSPPHEPEASVSCNLSTASHTPDEQLGSDEQLEPSKANTNSPNIPDKNRSQEDALTDRQQQNAPLTEGAEGKAQDSKETASYASAEEQKRARAEKILGERYGSSHQQQRQTREDVFFGRRRT